MKSFLKIVLCIFAMFTTAGEVKSSTVINIFGDSRTAITLNDIVVMSRQAIGYNAFNKAAWMVDTVGNNAYRTDIVYGPDRQRWKTELKRNGSVMFAAV